MNFSQFNLKDILSFQPSEGKIIMGGERMLLFRQDSLRVLWQLLFEQLGSKMAQSIIFKFGYQCGMGDFFALSNILKWEDPLHKLAAGPLLHSWEGLVLAKAEKCEIELDQGKFYFQGTWENSFEAENHLLIHGKQSKSPVCFNLAGYASGWTTAFAGFPTIAIETTCVAKGDPICRWVIRDVASWGSEASEWNEALFSNTTSIYRKLEDNMAQVKSLNNNLEMEIKSRSQLIEQQAREIGHKKHLEALGEMTAGIAHEINNPLATLALGNKLARKELQNKTVNNEVLQRRLDQNYDMIQRISTIVRSMKAIGGKSDGEKHIVIDGLTILNNTLQLCLNRFNELNIQFGIENYTSENEAFIIGAEVQLSQVFMNLICNSVQALTELPKNDRWIKISINKSNTYFEFRFVDGGKGIPQDIRDKIMRPFFTTKEVGQGTGLGLSLSSSIIKNHGGDLYYEEGQANTCFVVKIPCKPDTEWASP